jgi:hypothetical protein
MGMESILRRKGKTTAKTEAVSFELTASELRER